MKSNTHVYACLIVSAGLGFHLMAPPALFCAEPDAARLIQNEPIEIPKLPAIDFETYQRNIDDIYQIALMTNPNVDSGVNGMIVDLNRKIADNPQNTESLIALAHVYRILGQPSEANRFYEKALKLDPNNFHLNLFAAMTNIRSKNYDRALAELDQAIEKSPADLYAWMARGRILMLLHRNKEAAENFEKARELEPENRQAAFSLSLAYQALGKNKKAFDMLKKLKSQDPDNTFIRYHLGALALANGEAREAITYWEGLFKEGLRDIPFLMNLAVAYLQKGDAGTAKQILNHLNFFFPREIELDFLKAEAYRQLNLFKDAELQYRLVLVEDPNYLSASVGLGDVLMRQGKLEQSRTVLAQAEQQAMVSAQKPGKNKRLKLTD